MKKTIELEVGYEELGYVFDGGTFESVIEKLTTLRDDCINDNPDLLNLNFSIKYDVVGEFYYISADGIREESDAEYEARIVSEKLIDEKEHREYLRLKEKYGYDMI